MTEYAVHGPVVVGVDGSTEALAAVECGRPCDVSGHDLPRGRADATLPVLLAADGSPANDSAIGFAFEEATLRGVPLVALHVWSHPASAGRLA